MHEEDAFGEADHPEGGRYKDKPARAFAARSANPPPLLVCAGVCAVVIVLYLVVHLMTAFAAGSHRRAAFAMSLGAGMATGLGAALVLCTRSLDRRLLAATMSFSAGVMLYVSLVEVVGVANEHFAQSYSVPTAYAYATGSFFCGVGVMAVVDRLVHTVFDMVSGAHGHGARTSPSGGGAHGIRAAHDHDHESENGRCLAEAGSHDDGYDVEALDDEGGASIIAVAQVEERSRLLMMAAVVSAAIVLHNIPEGMATYVASFHSVTAGAPLAIAIAIHNIPEGLAIAMPVFYATRSRTKAVGLGALSGMSEPFGALLASLVANENSSTGAFGFMFGLTGGMMAYVCIAELLPAAFLEKGVSRDLVTAAFFAGCTVMAMSLVIEKFATAA